MELKQEHFMTKDQPSDSPLSSVSDFQDSLELRWATEAAVPAAEAPSLEFVSPSLNASSVETWTPLSLGLTEEGGSG